MTHYQTTTNRLKGYLPKGAVLESVEQVNYEVTPGFMKEGFRLIYKYKGEVYRAHVGNPGSRFNKG